MAYTLPREPSTQESLQCLACAGLQVIGPNFSEEDLIKLMRGTHDNQSEVKRLTGIHWPTMEPRFKEWSEDPADPALLGIWLYSSITIAKSLKNSQYLTGNYKFYRQDQFPESGKIKSFKDVFDLIKTDLKKATSKDAKFGKGVAGKVYRNLTLNSDKWNPADIVAVRESSSAQWSKEISTFMTSVKLSPSSLKDDLSSYARSLQKKGGNFEKLDIIPAMEDLYEYNKLIAKGLTSKQFVPISLKKSERENPHVGLIMVKEPKDLEKYFHMTVQITDVEYKPTTQKALVKFEVDGLPGKDGKWSFDIRGFETTQQIVDIQMGLLKKGSATYHGKITLPVSTMITKLSGGRAALSKLNAEKRKRFGKISVKAKSKMKSSIHGLTDYRIFSEYYAKNNANIIADAQAWGDYVQFLSGGETKAAEFYDHATGGAFHTPKAVKYGLKQSHTQAKYMKNKVQSYEMAYIIDKSNLNDQIKKNILKSMWMYAASEGFTIFNQSMNTNFLLAGSYIKCAA